MLSLMRVTLFGRAVPYARDTSVSLARIVAHLEQYYTERERERERERGLSAEACAL